MEFFRNAKVVRFRSHHDKYLFADEDGETVTQDKDGESTNARWTVEFIDQETLRLKSCYGRYLTASSKPFKLGLRGNRVLQTQPKRLDSSLIWEPVKDGGYQIRLRTPYGQLLCANGGLPPWRNSITHDAPNKTVRLDWILWDVDVVEKLSDNKVTTNDEDLELALSSEPLSSEGESEDSGCAKGSKGKRHKIRKEVRANVIRISDKFRKVALNAKQKRKQPSLVEEEP